MLSRNGGCGAIEGGSTEEKIDLHFQPLFMNLSPFQSAKPMKHRLLFLSFLLISVLTFGQLVEETYTYDGIDRSFFLYLPDNIQPGAPLVFVLHGYTGSASSTISSYGMNDIADANGFAVCYPQGSQDLTGTNFWNINFPLETVDDVGFLSSLAQDLTNFLDLDANCTYVCGMSNGGMMSYYLGCERPDVFKAFASVTGTITSNFLANCMGNIPVPFMQIHGTFDLIVPYNGSTIAEDNFGEFLPVEEIFRTWNDINDCQSVDFFSVPNAPVLDFSSVSGAEVSDCDGNLKAKFYRVENGGHTWPGSPQIPFIDFLQPTNQDINASEEIWNFFSSICAPSGIAEYDGDVLNEEVELYPNPGYGAFYLDVQGMSNSTVNVFSIDGRLVHQQIVNEGQNYLSLFHLDKGFYLARIQGDEDHVIKFVIE